MKPGIHLHSIVMGLVLVYPVSCLSAPTINLAAAAGATVVLSGSGFGTKPAAAPLKWENFEDGTVGADIATTGYWEQKTSGIQRPIFTAANPRGASRLSIQHTNDSSNCNDAAFCGMSHFWKNDIGFAATKKAFVSLWTRTDWGDGPIVGGYQIKPFRLSAGHYGGGSIYPSLSFVSWWDTNATKRVWTTLLYPADNKPANNTGYVVDGVAENFSAGTEYRPNTDTTMPDDQWTNIKIQYSASSTPGAPDATYKMWQQRPDGTSYLIRDATTCAGTCTFTHPNAATAELFTRDLINSIKVEYNFDNVNDGIYHRITPQTDDIYMDNSWARVEICNAVTYSGSGHCEIQPATAWTDGQISVNFNAGSFTPGQKVYFYVADADGVVNSSGFEYTVGSGAAPVRPTGLGRIPASPGL